MIFRFLLRTSCADDRRHEPRDPSDQRGDTEKGCVDLWRAPRRAIAASVILVAHKPDEAGPKMRVGRRAGCMPAAELPEIAVTAEALAVHDACSVERD